MDNYISHFLAGQFIRLLHPIGDLRFVKLIVLVDVKIAHILLLGLTGWERTQRRAAEEGHFDVFREAVKAEEPRPVLDAVEWRVPFDRLAHAGNGLDDQRVQPSPTARFQPGMAAI